MTEKVKGVRLNKSRNKWIAEIKVDGESKHLGSFETYEEAVKARKDAEVEYGFVPITPPLNLKHKNDLTQEMLKELFHYNKDTGIFTWKAKPAKNIKAGSLAGSISNGYIKIRINKKSYLAHRLAFLYITGEFPEEGLEVDHINHIRDDNRFSNLRLVTHQGNLQNKTMQSNNKVGCCGVHWDNIREKWNSRIKVNGESVFLGRFKNKEDAIAARKQAEIEHNFHQNHGKVA